MASFTRVADIMVANSAAVCAEATMATTCIAQLYRNITMIIMNMRILKHVLYFVPFQALVSVGLNRGVRYFDDQARDGATPTYSWRKMKICSPFYSWGRSIETVYSDPLTVVFGGALYVGALFDLNHFHVCSRYSVNSGEWQWQDLDNISETEYDYGSVEPSMIELDGYIYVIGGTYDETACTSINKYDIAKNCFVECGDLKEGVAECSLVIMDKKVLILDTKRCMEDEKHNVIIQMYDPTKNESFIVLEDADLFDDSSKHDNLLLTVQSGLCYMICDPEQECTASDPDDSDGESCRQAEQYPQICKQNPRVFKLACNFENNPPSVILGEEIPQTHPHRNNYIRAFCIDAKTFVNVRGCVHKIKDGIANEEDLKKWHNITKTSFGPVHFTFDRTKLSGTAGDER